MLDLLTTDCACWKHRVSIVFMDPKIPKELIINIYCPECSKGIKKDEAHMKVKNGWVVEYAPDILNSISATIQFIPRIQRPEVRVEEKFLFYVKRDVLKK